MVPVFNGIFEDMYSEPLQYRRDLSGMSHTSDQAQAFHKHKQVAHTHPSAAQTHTPALHPAVITDDSVVSPLDGAFNRLHLEPVQEKEEVDGAASASGQRETEERSILDELRQVEQRWYNSQTPKQQHHQQQR
ncbi:TRAF family member-associated NF-kappa-B activator-like isoform X1, partial [Clarias magur]